MSKVIKSFKPKPVYDILNGKKKLFEDKHAFKTGDVIWVYETFGSYKQTVEFARGQGRDIKQSVYHFPNGCKKYFKDGIWYYDTFIKGKGKVVAKFVVGEVIKCNNYEWLNGANEMHGSTLSELSCVTDEELEIYSKCGKKPLYFHEITQLEILDKPKELGEFKHYKKYGMWTCLEPLTHAPQSFVYIEVLNAD